MSLVKIILPAVGVSIFQEGVLRKVKKLLSKLLSHLFRIQKKMKKLALSKNKKEIEDEDENESESSNKEEAKIDDSSEEKIDTKKQPKILVGKRKVKKMDHEFMNSEKERYLSRLANVADLISSSDSEPDDEEDGEFDLDIIEPESDSNPSEETSSLKNSSQITSSLATESDNTSFVADSQYSKETPTHGKKRISVESYISAESSLPSNKHLV